MPATTTPSRETSADQSCRAVLFKIRPPATLFFTDTAKNGIKVKYLRHAYPEPSAEAAPTEPAAKTIASA